MGGYYTWVREFLLHNIFTTLQYRYYGKEWCPIGHINLMTGLVVQVKSKNNWT